MGRDELITLASTIYLFPCCVNTCPSALLRDGHSYPFRTPILPPLLPTLSIWILTDPLIQSSYLFLDSHP